MKIKYACLIAAQGKDNKTMMAWTDLFSALALVLVIEGIMPFISPKGWRETMLQASRLEDKTLRTIGLGSMLVGAILLFLMR